MGIFPKNINARESCRRKLQYACVRLFSQKYCILERA
jgi:hypothetical protein